VVQPGDDLDLAEEALGGDGDDQLGAEDLQGHQLAVGRAGPEDAGSGPPTDLGFDRVAVAQGGADEGEEVAGDGALPSTRPDPPP
jgi:hypothetical protein